MKHFLKGLGAMVVIAILIVIILGLFGVLDNEPVETHLSDILNADETHHKYVKSANIQYRTFTVSSFDSLAIIDFVKRKSDSYLSVDYFLFYLPEDSPIWLEKFNTVDEINLAIYQTCPPLILYYQNDYVDRFQCEDFKPYDY